MLPTALILSQLRPNDQRALMIHHIITLTAKCVLKRSIASI
ncbi:hypothetical protein TERTU_2082 [Teredinibacter turnerae T7901]|uniref:Uncharacterized protein n=1 Tax=Teredinibacter turnerae (strain ATCC 39867 / T7901) TaxID=377629 RepID=C5BIU4_TERTT|nr:hypothetical protein TERTU_2082 [Teredinibacter turnerae T7901]